MNLLPSNREYMLDQFKVEVHGPEAKIGWRYFGGSTHFIILISDAFDDYTLDSLADTLKQKGVSDAELIANGHYKLSEEPGAVGQVFLTSVQQYDRDQRGWKYNLRQLTGGRNIPLKVTVFACVVRNRVEIDVYRSEKTDNIAYFPLTVRYSQVVKGLGKKTAQIHLDAVQQYKEGSIGYKIPEIGIDIPLTGAALGKDLEVKLPGKDGVEFYVAKESAKYYKLEEYKRK